MTKRLFLPGPLFERAPLGGVLRAFRVGQPGVPPRLHSECPLMRWCLVRARGLAAGRCQQLVLDFCRYRLNSCMPGGTPKNNGGKYPATAFAADSTRDRSPNYKALLISLITVHSWDLQP